MFSYEGKDRATLDNIKDHPWMQMPCNDDDIKGSLIKQI